MWEWAAKVSRLVRVRSYFLETFSEVVPMGMRQSIAGGDFFIMDQSTSGMGILFIGLVDMLYWLFIIRYSSSFVRSFVGL